MKKLAIIGSSSTLVEDGYAIHIKNYLGNDCDIYGAPASGIINVVFKILQEDIIGSYEYVLIQFGPIDPFEAFHGSGNPYFVISAINFIVSKFADSASIPVFFKFSYGYGQEPTFYYQYIINAMARICKFPFFDTRDLFKYIDRLSLTRDGAHYKNKYSSFLGKVLLDKIFSYSKPDRYCFEQIKFKLLERGSRNDTHIELISSLSNSFQTYLAVINPDTSIVIPPYCYLSGIEYIYHDTLPYINYRNSYINLTKNLNIPWATKYPVCQSLGHSVLSGLLGGTISSCTNREYTFYERSSLSNATISIEKFTPIYCNLLLCDRPPIKFGASFYNRHLPIFIDEKDISNLSILERKNYIFDSFAEKLARLAGDASLVLIRLLRSRPDLNLYLKDTELKAEKLLVWAWRYGINEDHELSLYKDLLKAALKSMYLTPYLPTIDMQYSLLFHVLWLLNPSLHKFDPYTAEGRTYINRWIQLHGIKEYNLNSII